MGLLETQALTASERLAESSIGKIRNLPEPQRIDVMNAIFDARRIAAEAGMAALDATERAALRIGNDVVGDAGGVPAWAAVSTRASYERIAHLGRRTDVHSLIEADPSLLRQIADDPDIRAAIELQAYRDPADFRKVFASEQKRTRGPLSGAFTEANEDHWLPKQVMKTARAAGCLQGMSCWKATGRNSAPTSFTGRRRRGCRRRARARSRRPAGIRRCRSR